MADVIRVRQFMRVLIAAGRDIEAVQFLMDMIVAMLVIFHEGKIIVMEVAIMAKVDAGDELVRLWNFLGGYPPRSTKVNA